MSKEAEELVEEVSEEKKTQLDRLGSTKSLVAATDAQLNDEEVLTAAADAEYAARETFLEWAEDEEGMVSKSFERYAGIEEKHYEKVRDKLGDEYEPNKGGGSLHEYLRGLNDTVERVSAGLIGRTLASDESLKQFISYFVGQSDIKKSDLFRELRDDNDEMIEEGKELLAEICENDKDWQRAREVAEETIQVVYDEYAETLESMGINPKPVC